MTTPQRAGILEEHGQEIIPKASTRMLLSWFDSLTMTLSSVEGSGVQFRFRLDSRLTHAGMTIFGKELGFG